MTSEPRRLRNGTHQPCNIYYAEIPPGVHDDDGQLGYIRIGDVAVAMVEAYNAMLDPAGLAGESMWPEPKNRPNGQGAG